jgi:hypothetical protein
MVDAWVDGRPKVYDPTQRKSTDRNYGKDYSTAEDMFGADIWDRVYQYKSTPKDQRKGLYADLKLGDWSDWWYGNMPEQERRATLPAYAFRGGGGRSFGGGGGGGGGGGYSGGTGGTGGSGNYRPYVPQVDPRYMDQDLQVEARFIQPWRKERFDDEWMFAGNQLKPTRTNWR